MSDTRETNKKVAREIAERHHEATIVGDTTSRLAEWIEEALDAKDAKKGNPLALGLLEGARICERVGSFEDCPEDQRAILNSTADIMRARAAAKEAKVPQCRSCTPGDRWERNLEAVERPEEPCVKCGALTVWRQPDESNETNEHVKIAALTGERDNAQRALEQEKRRTHAVGPDGETAYHAEGNWYVQLGYQLPRLRVWWAPSDGWRVMAQKPGNRGVYVDVSDAVGGTTGGFDRDLLKAENVRVMEENTRLRGRIEAQRSHIAVARREKGEAVRDLAACRAELERVTRRFDTAQERLTSLRGTAERLGADATVRGIDYWLAHPDVPADETVREQAARKQSLSEQSLSEQWDGFCANPKHEEMCDRGAFDAECLPTHLHEVGDVWHYTKEAPGSHFATQTFKVTRVDKTILYVLWEDGTRGTWPLHILADDNKRGVVRFVRRANETWPPIKGDVWADSCSWTWTFTGKSKEVVDHKGKRTVYEADGERNYRTWWSERGVEEALITFVRRAGETEPTS